MSFKKYMFVVGERHDYTTVSSNAFIWTNQGCPYRAGEKARDLKMRARNCVNLYSRRHALKNWYLGAVVEVVRYE